MQLLKIKNFKIFKSRFVSIFSGDSLDEGSTPSTSTSYPYSLRVGPAHKIGYGQQYGGVQDSMGYTKVRKESRMLLNGNANLTKALALSAIAYSKAPELVTGEFALELAA